MTGAEESTTGVAVVGAGVVGLAVAAALAPDLAPAPDGAALVVERNAGFARETSAHNSGVVHAGIYYPTGSLKHRSCVEGNAALYAWCEAHGVPVRRTGKLIVALSEAEVPALDELERQARANAVPGLTRLTATQARSLEPAIPAVEALLSPSTGVVDQFAFARSLESAARADGALFAYRHEVTACARTADGFELSLRDADGATSTVRAGAVVNCAGHGAPALAAAAGYPLDGGIHEGVTVPAFRQRPNRGRYYDIVDAELARSVTRPVYPLPDHEGGGLGVHLTVDIDSGVHLGPDTEWMPEDAPLDYRADDVRRAEFLAAGRRLLPGLRDEQIAPGQVGYRPKLQQAGEAQADFLLWHDRGYVHLGGIESPGLTAALALARMVRELLTEGSGEGTQEEGADASPRS